MSTERSQATSAHKTIRRKVVSSQRVYHGGSRAFELKLSCGHHRTIYPVNADVPATSRCSRCERERA